jgi:peptidoglycan-N-acetylglucosamine deacetylase
MLLRALSFVGTAVATVVLALVFVTMPPSRIDPANAYFQQSNIFRSGLAGTKTLALTFDDGPSSFTGQLLDTLAANNVHATFFVVGSRVHQHPEAMARMMREGHVIANHSFTHARLGRRYAQNPELLITEIGTTHAAIAPYLRANQGLYFRAPYGVWRQAHADFLNRDPLLQKYVGPVYWDIGGNIAYDDEGHMRSAADWDCWAQDLTAEQCARGYLHEIERRKGGIVLMHDIRERSLWMVKQLLPALVAEGYRFVTLDEVKEFDQYKAPIAPDVPVAANGGALPFGVSAR